MSIHILYEFRDGPWGGGNQFLKALRTQFRNEGIYAESPEEADAILFNSHHFGPGNTYLDALLRLRRHNPDLVLVQRIDGPIQAVRGTDRQIDNVIYRANALLADGTIFQTEWSRKENVRRGLISRHHAETVINNAPDSGIFHPSKESSGRSKTRLIATSWAANSRKGFGYYDFLDRKLDWSRFEMRFVGNTPQAFKNIVHIPPQDSAALSKLLRDSDIFITGSSNDPCSNSLLEALHSGLPAVALKSGGHPELVGDGGVLFEGEADLIDAIETVAAQRKDHRKRISVRSLCDIAGDYAHFIHNCPRDVRPPGENIGLSIAKAELKMRMRWASLSSRISSRLGRFRQVSNEA